MLLSLSQRHTLDQGVCWNLGSTSFLKFWLLLLKTGEFILLFVVKVIVDVFPQLEANILNRSASDLSLTEWIFICRTGIQIRNVLPSVGFLRAFDSKIPCHHKEYMLMFHLHYMSFSQILIRLKIDKNHIKTIMQLVYVSAYNTTPTICITLFKLLMLSIIQLISLLLSPTYNLSLLWWITSL